MGRMERRPSALGKLRQRHEWTVVDALRRAGALTRADLVDHTGLSRSTVSALVAELQHRGILEERARSPRPPSTPGRLGGAVALRTSAGVAGGHPLHPEAPRGRAGGPPAPGVPPPQKAPRPTPRGPGVRPPRAPPPPP